MKIAICVPVHGDTKARFTVCLARLMMATATATINWAGRIVRPTVEIFSYSSSRLAESRQWLADEAIDWGADFVLWADADHDFPRDALLRLLSASKDAAGVNYVTRDGERPAAITPEGEAVFTTEAKAKARLIEEVGSIGLGLCLVRAPAIKKLPRPWFAYEIRDDGSVVSEDHYFFSKLRASGSPVYVDHALSWEVGHIGERTFRHSDLEGSRADTVLSASGP